MMTSIINDVIIIGMQVLGSRLEEDQLQTPIPHSHSPSKPQKEYANKNNIIIIVGVTRVKLLDVQQYIYITLSPPSPDVPIT